MGFELLVGPEGEETEAFEFGSATAVSEFRDYLLTLPEVDYPLLRKFADAMETTNGDALSDELADAIKSHPPDSEGLNEMIHEFGDTCVGLEEGTLFRVAS